MDRSHMTEEQKTDEWRQFHAEHVERQSKAIESIRNYVAIWFWLTIAGSIILVALVASANSF